MNTPSDFYTLVCEQQSAPMLFISSPGGEILRANGATVTLTGYDLPELIRMQISDLLLLPATGEPLCAADLTEKQTAWLSTPHGLQHTVEIHVSRFSHDGADLLFCLFHDITGQIRVEQAVEHLEKTRDQLEIIVDERTQQLNETMDHLMRESVERRLIESNVATMQQKLEQQERARVARDIHDGIGQSLQAVKLQLKMRQARCKIGEPCGGGALTEVIQEITSVSTELREVIMALRPQFLEEASLDSAVRALCERVSKRSNLNIRSECSGTFRGISVPLKMAIFRICQEALTNIMKHSRSSSAAVQLDREARRLRLIIRDDGIGGVPSPAVICQEGSGLTIMRERVELLSGTFTVISPPGMGTIITAEVPLP